MKINSNLGFTGTFRLNTDLKPVQNATNMAEIGDSKYFYPHYEGCIFQDAGGYTFTNSINKKDKFFEINTWTAKSTAKMIENLEAKNIPFVYVSTRKKGDKNKHPALNEYV